MTQSEELMQGVEFGVFKVDLDAFDKWADSIMVQFEQAKARLAEFGMEKFNSTKQVREWFESLGIDCSRGTGKEVYAHPVNIAMHPAEMGAFAEVKRLENLRRKISTFRGNLS